MGWCDFVNVNIQLKRLLNFNRLAFEMHSNHMLEAIKYNIREFYGF